MTTSKLYYDPVGSSAFSTLVKQAAATPKKNKFDALSWLKQQDISTFHLLIKKRFLRNLYIVTNVMEIRKCYLLDYSPSENTIIYTDTFYP